MGKKTDFLIFDSNENKKQQQQQHYLQPQDLQQKQLWQQ